jgi:hypothetical protein
VAVGGRLLDVQVKGTSSSRGSFSWRTEGAAKVEPWIASAKAAGRDALFALVHLARVPCVATINADGEMVVSRPTVLSITFLSAVDWGRMVDETRAEYAATPWASKAKQSRGVPRSADNCARPMNVCDGMALEEVLAGL